MTCLCGVTVSPSFTTSSPLSNVLVFVSMVGVRRMRKSCLIWYFSFSRSRGSLTTLYIRVLCVLCARAKWSCYVSEQKGHYVRTNGCIMCQSKRGILCMSKRGILCVRARVMLCVVKGSLCVWVKGSYVSDQMGYNIYQGKRVIIYIRSKGSYYVSDQMVIVCVREKGSCYL